MDSKMTTFEPSYIKTHHNGLLNTKIQSASQILKSCVLCPRKCRVDRLNGETGVCKTADRAFVSSYNAHFGEEAPLVGTKGSGTIFFTHCSLMCTFCQNYDISHEGFGEAVSHEELAVLMLHLQNKGCHNINFVTPTHVVPQILAALKIAVENGLSIPLVYNTGSYDRCQTLGLLEGVFDIYMPDFKFWDPDIAEKTCDAPDYPEIAKKAILEMHRQVGDLIVDDTNIAQRGLLIRHLVLPLGLAGTREIMGFIASEISDNTYVNVMPQYRPCGRAAEIPSLAAPLSRMDFEAALASAEAAGLHRIDERKRVFMM
jgi:putative pyruvate formate lyase activating enzyme